MLTGAHFVKVVQARAHCELLATKLTVSISLQVPLIAMYVANNKLHDG